MELSVVVPTLNEEEELPGFLAMLAEQRDVAMELIVSDGGSADATADVVRSFAGDCEFRTVLIEGTRGRGRQLNAGARAAAGEFILFLHADSRFEDPQALRKGLDALQAKQLPDGSGHTAGRFGLRFRDMPSKGGTWRRMEAKARLNRPGCIHGDQGFLLPRLLFESMGPFEEDLPVMEDTRFADRVLRKGEWLVLPSEIFTSPRRFLKEGIDVRVKLNAVLMTLSRLERKDILQRLPELYPPHEGARTLDAAPLLGRIAAEMALLPAAQRLRFWCLIGTYVRENAWQLFFRLDQKCGKTVFLPLYDRVLDPLIDNPPFRLLAGALARMWFEAECRDAKRSGRRVG